MTKHCASFYETIFYTERLLAEREGNWSSSVVDPLLWVGGFPIPHL